MFQGKVNAMRIRSAITAACCIALAAASTPAMAETRASSFLPLAQKSAVAGCAASRAAAEIAVQGAPTQGCLFPLKGPPAAVQPVTPAPAAPPVAAPIPPAPAAGGGFGWLAPVLGGLAAIVGAFALFGGGDDDGSVPGISPG